jgi:hypothetical protein
MAQSIVKHEAPLFEERSTCGSGNGLASAVPSAGMTASGMMSPSRVTTSPMATTTQLSRSRGSPRDGRHARAWNRGRIGNVGGSRPPEMRRMELVSLRRSRHRLWSRLRSRPRRRHHHDVTHFGRLTLRVQQRRNLMGMSMRCGRDQPRVGHGRRIGGLETLNTRTSSLCRKGLLSEWKMAMPRGEALRLEQ